MSTWYDLKLAVLQKMFAADDIILTDESTLGYLSAMPHCANEGLALLATAGKFITKSVKIAQMKIDNLVADSEASAIHEFSDSYSYQVDEGQSFYFEVTGTGTCDIYVGDFDTPLDTIDINACPFGIRCKLHIVLLYTIKLHRLVLLQLAGHIIQSAHQFLLNLIGRVVRKLSIIL